MKSSFAPLVLFLVAAAGQVQFPLRAIAESGAGHDQLYPAVASGGTNFFVVWMDGRNADTTQYDIYGARVSGE